MAHSILYFGISRYGLDKSSSYGYAVEACFKYNNRGKSNVFESFIQATVAA